MKKCASCTKDLPEAALHCVFCGAKQAPAPAVQPGVAKTAFGYSANDVIDHMNKPRTGPSQPPPMAYAATQASFGEPAADVSDAQLAAADAPTVFVPMAGSPAPSPQISSGPAPMSSYQAPPPAQQPTMMQPPPQMMQPQGGMVRMAAPQPMPMQPMQVAPQLQPRMIQPIPSAAPPYLGSHAGRAGHPIEPWKDSLRAMMFIWGVVTLAAFCTPISIDPLAFNWDAIIHGEGKAKLPMLIVASIGLLSIVIAGIPMSPLPRGMLAALLGLVGIIVPMLIAGGMGDHWQLLLILFGTLLLVPGLLVRNEYRDAAMPRVLITAGMLFALLPLLVPDHGQIPLVGLFKMLIDAPGKAKVGPALQLGLIVVLVLSLLAWMPAPATGGAKVIAWVLILYPLFEQVVMLLVGGNIGEHIKASPFASLMVWAPAATYVVLVGYGGATVLGKQLE